MSSIYLIVNLLDHSVESQNISANSPREALCIVALSDQGKPLTAYNLAMAKRHIIIGETTIIYNDGICRYGTMA